MDNERYCFDKSPGGRGFLFDRLTGDVYSLNPAGALIVNSLLHSVSSVDIPELLSGQFDIPLREARKDVVEFLGRLAELGLVCEEDHGHD